MLRLAAHRLFPFDAEPFEIAVDGGLELRRAARRVDVLDAQQQPSAGLPRHVGVEQRRIGVAEMQFAIGAWREAEDGLGHFRLVMGPCAGLVRNGAGFGLLPRPPDCYLSDPQSTRTRRKRRCSEYRPWNDIAAALDALCVIDPRLTKVRAAAGEVPLRLSEPGFSEPHLNRHLAAGFPRQRRRDLRAARQARRSADAGSVACGWRYAVSRSRAVAAKAAGRACGIGSRAQRP